MLPDITYSAAVAFLFRLVRVMVAAALSAGLAFLLGEVEVLNTGATGQLVPFLTIVTGAIAAAAKFLRDKGWLGPNSPI